MYAKHYAKPSMITSQPSPSRYSVTLNLTLRCSLAIAHLLPPLTLTLGQEASSSHVSAP